MSAGWAASTLRWWSDAGVDVIVGETPRDWLNPASRISQKAAVAEPEPAPALPETLEAFQDWLLNSVDLPGAAASAPRLAPAGSLDSGVMILTDVPTLEDFTAGRLVSSDGLFDKMLNAIHLSRDSLYLASLSPFRPPSGTLAPDELQRCADIARHHIFLVAPKAVLLLGDLCARALTGAPVNQSRSRWHEIETNGARFRALVTLKPEQLNLQPNLKTLAWADLQMLEKEIQG